MSVKNTPGCIFVPSMVLSVSTYRAETYRGGTSHLRWYSNSKFEMVFVNVVVVVVVAPIIVQFLFHMTLVDFVVGPNRDDLLAVRCRSHPHSTWPTCCCYFPSYSLYSKRSSTYVLRRATLLRSSLWLLPLVDFSICDFVALESSNNFFGIGGFENGSACRRINFEKMSAAGSEQTGNECKYPKQLKWYLEHTVFKLSAE